MPFLYLGVVVLAWVVVWKYLFHGFLARHADSPWAQGASAVVP